MISRDNILKILENLEVYNLLETRLQFTYPTDFYIVCSHLYYWENENIRFV